MNTSNKSSKKGKKTIITAGQGSRLMPITNDKTKYMLERDIMQILLKRIFKI